MKLIRHGVIGLGKISEEHIRGISSLTDMSVVAICTRNEEVLNRRGNELGIPTELRFTDYHDLLNCPNVDSISICTPNFQHYSMVKDALEAGIPFAVEKPLSLDITQALELNQIQSIRQVPHMLCFSYRFMPAARYARHLVHTGALGELRHVFAQYDQGWGNDTLRPLSWRFQKELSGYGALGDLGSHLIDLVRFIVGDFDSVTADMGILMPKRLLPNGNEMGEVTVDDYAMFLARLQGGIPAMLETTRFAYGHRNLQRVAIYGSTGGIIYEQDLIDGELCSHLDVCLSENDFRENRYSRIMIPEEFSCTQMDAFARRLHGDESGLAATLEDGLICQKVMDAVSRSAQTGQWEKV